MKHKTLCSYIFPWKLASKPMLFWTALVPFSFSTKSGRGGPALDITSIGSLLANTVRHNSAYIWALMCVPWKHVLSQARRWFHSCGGQLITFNVPFSGWPMSGCKSAMVLVQLTSSHSRHGLAFTLAWVCPPIYPLGPYTYWRFYFDVNAIRQLCGSRGGTWVEVLLCCLYNRETQQHQHE